MSPLASRMCIALALAAAATAAHADIYTWIDKKGFTNVSNLPPPDDVKVTNVVRTQPKDAAREAAARDAAHQAEVRELADKVQQLQAEVSEARRDPPPVLAYAPPPPYAAAPTLSIVNIVQPAQPSSYAPTYGCDYSFGDCGLGLWPGFGYYGPSFIAAGRGRGFRHGPAGGPRNSQLVPPLIPPPSMGGGGGHLRPRPG